MEKKFSELEQAVQPIDPSLLVENNFEDVQVEVNETSPQDVEDVLTRAQFEQMMRQYKMNHRTPQQVRENPKIGRNDPCPCGSGKKYKNCCLQSGAYEKLKPVEKKK